MLRCPMRGKGFLDTAPTVALNDVQMAHLWITKEPPKEYSDFGEVSLHYTSVHFTSHFLGDCRLPPL